MPGHHGIYRMPSSGHGHLCQFYTASCQQPVHSVTVSRLPMLTRNLPEQRNMCSCRDVFLLISRKALQSAGHCEYWMQHMVGRQTWLFLGNNSISNIQGHFFLQTILIKLLFDWGNNRNLWSSRGGGESRCRIRCLLKLRWVRILPSPIISWQSHVITHQPWASGFTERYCLVGDLLCGV